MKRKVYFLISSVVQIITSVYAIFSADKLISEMLKQTEIYPEMMQERINGLFQNSGHVFIITLAIIAILLNVLIICWACKDKLLQKKGKVIACSVCTFFTAMYPIVELASIINIIVIATAKRVNKEDYPEKVKDLPIIEKEKVDKKKIVLAIILFLVYFSQFLWSGIIIKTGLSKLLIGAIFYLMMIILSLTFFRDLFTDNFRVFKNNFKAYFNNLIGTVGKFYLVYFLIAMVTVFLAKADTSVNQSNVEALPIWYSFPLAVIYAPIVEESLFRGCIRRFIKNDKLFIVVSAITFGLLHTLFTELNVFNALVLAIPYMTIGGFLAYLYTKTNNMFTNMSFHAFHNTMAMIITILIKGI